MSSVISHLAYISENIKIICAIYNKFFRPLSSGAAEEDEIIAAKMKYHGAKLILIKLQMFYQISLTYQLKCCP
jgi:hypothetical protein